MKNPFILYNLRMLQLTDKQIRDIFQIIKNRLPVRLSSGNNEVCLCGSTKSISECCVTEPNYWISDKYLEDIIAYAKRLDFNIGQIPNTFIQRLETEFQNRFNVCAVPGCTNHCIGSHVFGSKHLQYHFNGNHSYWLVINDDGTKLWEPVGIAEKLKYKIFCKTCDYSLFTKIDTVQHDVSDTSNQMRHIFRTLAYQHQFNRSALGLAYQIAFAAIPTSFERNEYLKTTTTHESININHLIGCYIRYRMTTQEICDIYQLIQPGSIHGPSINIVSKTFQTKDVFFAQGIENPQQDLRGNKIQFSTDAGIVYVVLPEKVNRMRGIVFSRYKKYEDLLRQLEFCNEYKFKSFLSSLVERKNTPRSVLTKNKPKNHQKIIR